VLNLIDWNLALETEILFKLWLNFLMICHIQSSRLFGLCK